MLNGCFFEVTGINQFLMILGRISDSALIQKVSGIAVVILDGRCFAMSPKEDYFGVVALERRDVRIVKCYISIL